MNIVVLVRLCSLVFIQNREEKRREENEKKVELVREEVSCLLCSVGKIDSIEMGLKGSNQADRQKQQTQAKLI